MAGSRRLLPKDASEIETVAENHLRNQVIGRTRHANTEPKIDFPLGRKIQVNGRKDLLLLLADGVEARDRAQRSIVFDAASDFFVEIVAEFEIRREDQPLIHTGAVERAVKRGVKGEIPSSELLIHNWTNLPRPSVRGIPATLPADFIRKADAHWPAPLGRTAHARVDMAANANPNPATLCQREKGETRCGPARAKAGQ